MRSYQRAKREDAIKSSKQELQVSIGSRNESFESLQSKCNDKANELIQSVKLEAGEEMLVTFWTEDIPELIGTANITMNDNGYVTYSMDYSLTTLF